MNRRSVFWSAAVFSLLAVYPLLAHAATYTVTSASASGDNTLAWAVTQANTLNGTDTIVFNLPDANEITLEGPLDIFSPLVLDGSNGGRHVIIAGPGLDAAIRLLGGSEGSRITNLGVIRANTGIYLGSSGNHVTGCAIGTDFSGRSGVGNGIGVYVAGPANTLGGTQAGERNIICGNSGYGILVQGTREAKIINNYIGITPEGGNLGNELGVFLYEADGNQVGGSRNPGHFERNYISFNETEAVRISGSGNTVCGNFVGVGVDGMSAAGNLTGIHLVSGHGNLIGGLNSDPERPQGNVIGGHPDSYGITQSGGAGNQVLGNYLGLNAAGTAAIPNFSGIFISAGGGIHLGNGTPEGRNVIAGNLHYGSTLGFSDDGTRTPTFGHVVRGNWYGTSADGQAVIPNGDAAIWIESAHHSQIGGLMPGEGNVINGNRAGILIVYPSATGNTVVGNWLGILPDGSVSATRLTYAISIGNSANGNAIGLKDWDMGNLIANVENGILVDTEAAVGNGLFANTICAYSGFGILLANGANAGKPAPVIWSADSGIVSGTAQADDFIQVFVADQDDTANGGSLRLAGKGSADASGQWRVQAAGVADGDFVTALASDAANNTSGFSPNIRATGVFPTPTPVPMITATPETTATPAVRPLASGARLSIFPNPGRANVTLMLDLDQPGAIEIFIYNVAGEKVARLNAQGTAGQQNLVWDASQVATGIYFVRVLKQGEEVAQRKIAIVR